MQAELFDRYVRQVGRRLPKKQRADVETELYSLLMDALQDRVGAQGVEGDTASEEDQVAVLREIGPPDEMAAQYIPPHRYLIGPRVYSVYLIVLAATAGGLSVAYAVLLVMAMFGMADPWSDLLSTLGELIPSYVGALISGFGAVTLTFAILERVLPETAIQLDDEEAEWDPRALPEIENRTSVSTSGLLVEIGLCLIALVALNWLPQWIEGTFEWTYIIQLSPAFYALYLPLINLSLVLTIVLKVVLLRQGKWQRLTRLADFGLALFGIYILVRMVFGLPLFVDGDLPGLGTLLSTIVKLALGIALIVSVVEVVQKLIAVFRTGPAEQQQIEEGVNP